MAPIEGVIIITHMYTSHYESFTMSGTGYNDNAALVSARAEADREEAELRAGREGREDLRVG
jgi:hypothetical protein